VKASLDQQVSDHSNQQIWLGAGNVVPVAERYNANGSSSSAKAIDRAQPRGRSVWSVGNVAVIAIFLAFVVGTVRSGRCIRSKSGRR
jgi:hypothetical protein